MIDPRGRCRSHGTASKLVGEEVAAPPLQLVGKKCAKSGKTIAYEPDARVRSLRAHLPPPVGAQTCECGFNLQHLREKAA